MFVVPRMNNGGAERVVANLSNYLCKRHDVRIVSIVSKDSYYELAKDVELCGQDFKINRKNIFTTLGCYAKYFWGAKKFIKKNVEEFRPDCVISFLVEADYLTYLATKGNRRIVRICSERADPTRRSKARQALAKRAYRHCDLFVCQSKQICKYYDYVPDNKKVIIPNPLDCSVLPEPVLKEQNHNIVSVGRLTKQKNYKLLIESFALSINELPNDCSLVIYGDGPLKTELTQHINDVGLRDRIQLAGVSKHVLSEIKNTALFVLSSDYEGFPNALLEAMAVGLPVISTDFYTGVARELIGKQNGIIVPIGDKKKLSSAIIDIMQKKKQRDEMRKHNVTVREKYSIDAVGSLWVDNITKRLGQKNEK